MKLQEAARLAERCVEVLTPFCERIEIAGSIRRARPNVNDIDLVALPKPGQEAALRARIEKNGRPPRVSGPQTIVFDLAGGFQVDLWLAHAREADLVAVTPGNFGTLYLCRTGAKEFNIWLAKQAQAKGLHWNPHHGIFRDKEWLAGETEEDVFRALALDWIPPVERER